MAYSGLSRQLKDRSALGIQILESRGGYTADEEIIELAKLKGQNAIVISSDREVMTAAIKAGCSVLTAPEFEREIAKIFRANPAMRSAPRPTGKGQAFRPPKEKKKALLLLRKYQ